MYRWMLTMLAVPILVGCTTIAGEWTGTVQCGPMGLALDINLSKDGLLTRDYDGTGVLSLTSSVEEVCAEPWQEECEELSVDTGLPLGALFPCDQLPGEVCETTDSWGGTLAADFSMSLRKEGPVPGDAQHLTASLIPGEACEGGLSRLTCDSLISELAAQKWFWDGENTIEVTVGVCVGDLIRGS